MSVSFDTSSLFSFLTDTPESGLKKMLVDGKPMTDIHFNLLMKFVRNTNSGDFKTHCEAGTLPSLKLSPAEHKIKEAFWKDCVKTFESRGLLQPAVPQKTAA
jgi:hypothetical protein